MGVGVDIINLNRLDLNNDKFIHFVLSPLEIEIFNKRKDKREYLGSRWASKEAFIKAKNDRNIDFKNIVILNEDSGKPYIMYNGEKYKNISISHEKEYAISVVVI